MLRRITEDLHAQLEATGYFEKIFPLVKQVQKGDEVYPAMYCEDGQLKHVSNFDNYNGMAYIRMTGKERFEKASDEFSMCESLMTIEYPMRIVACVPKSKLSQDDAFTEERVSRTLIAAITRKGGAIKQTLKAEYYEQFPESADFDSRRILSEEYSGLKKMQDINYNFSYHAIDFIVSVRIKASCLTNECEEAYYG